MPETANAVFGVPQKKKDPGSFIISIGFGENHVAKAMLDNGASIKLMPYAVYEQLILGEIQLTGMIVKMVDRSLRRPLGIVENVLVNVDRLLVPVDFVMEGQENTCDTSGASVPYC